MTYIPISLSAHVGMLPGFIIEEIRKREKVREAEQPSLQLPLPSVPEPTQREEADLPNRGVLVIQT